MNEIKIGRKISIDTKDAENSTRGYALPEKVVGEVIRMKLGYDGGYWILLDVKK